MLGAGSFVPTSVTRLTIGPRAQEHIQQSQFHPLVGVDPLQTTWLERGAVRSRVALLLRSSETQPLFNDLSSIDGSCPQAPINHRRPLAPGAAAAGGGGPRSSQGASTLSGKYQLPGGRLASRECHGVKHDRPPCSRGYRCCCWRPVILRLKAIRSACSRTVGCLVGT